VDDVRTPVLKRLTIGLTRGPSAAGDPARLPQRSGCEARHGKDISRPCERCGNLRWLLLERRLGLIALAMAVLAAGVVLNVLLPGPTGRGALLVGAVLACMIFGALVRVRCVRWEPALRMKA
jgi:hypothetical protein